MAMKHRKPPPPRWQPKPGHMLFYNDEVPIGDVETHAKAVIGNFDQLPRKRRDEINEGGNRPKKRSKWKP